MSHGAQDAVSGIGKVEVDDPGVSRGTTPHVLLDEPPLLGSLPAPKGFGPANSEATSVGLLNEADNGFLAGPVVLTYEVNPILQLATIGLWSFTTLLVTPCFFSVKKMW